MSDRVKVVLAYTAICTIWGSTWLAIKLGLETMPPLISAGLRFIVAGIVLFSIIKIRKIKIPWNSSTYWFFILVSLTSFSIPFGLVYWGEQKVSSGLTSILFAVFPFCVAIMSTIFLPNERLTAAKVLGIIFGFLGIVTIFFQDVQFGTGAEQFFGMAAIVLSAVIQAFSAVIIKKHGHDISPFVVSFIPMAFAGIFLVSSSLILENVTTMHFSFTGIVSICYLSIFGSVATFVSYFWLLKRVEVVLLSLTSFITPIIAVVLGVVILNEHVSSYIFAGTLLVLLGILTANASDIQSLIRRRFARNDI